MLSIYHLEWDCIEVKLFLHFLVAAAATAVVYVVLHILSELHRLRHRKLPGPRRNSFRFLRDAKLSENLKFLYWNHS